MIGFHLANVIQYTKKYFIIFVNKETPIFKSWNVRLKYYLKASTFNRGDRDDLCTNVMLIGMLIDALQRQEITI